MKLLKRSSNGNYSKLLETTIQDYLDSKNRLHTVRGLVKAIVITAQLAAFYGIEVPSLKKVENEPAWIKVLRNIKPKAMTPSSDGIFTELDIVSLLSGAIDCILQSPQDTEKLQQYYSCIVNEQSAEFLVILWKIGYAQQQT